MSECYACGSTKTFTYKSGQTTWRSNKGTNLVLCLNCYISIIYNPRKTFVFSDQERVCYACGSRTTSLKKEHGKTWQNWYLNEPTRLMLCNNCYNYYYRREYYKEYEKKNPNNIKYHRSRKHRVRDKIVYADREVKCGVCNWCRRVRSIDCNVTALHHDEKRYDLSNSLRFTIELCDICHKTEDWRLEKLGIKPIFY